MAQEIYHRSEWGNPTETWGNVYLNADLTNELYKRASEYENSWVTDQLLNGVGTKPSIILTPTAYEDGILNSVKPAKTFGSELVTNGSFDTDLSGWQIKNSDATHTVTHTSDGARFQSDTTSPILFFETIDIILQGGRKYSLTVEIVNRNSGELKIQGNNINLFYTDNGVFTDVIEPTGDSRISFYRNSANVDITIKNVSVKEIIDADFDFTRGSSATRVNEQGLVEDVQILSGELVQNGDFEQIGSELMPSIATIENNNGGIITQINGNSYSSTSDGTSSSSIRPKFDFATTSGKIYKLVITPTGTITGTVNFDFYDGSTYLFHNYDFTTTKEVYFKDNGGVFGAFDGTQTYSISNFTISVKEVGQNWTFFGEAEFTNNGARIYSSDGSNSYIGQLSILTNTKKYRLSYEITDSTTGSLKLINVNGQSSIVIPSTVGIHTLDFIANNANFYILRNSGITDVTIDNISVVEVTDDTDLPRINYTNFSYEDVLGDELVTNGSFDIDSNWVKGASWSISDGKASSDGTSNNSFSQNGILTIGKTYKLTLDLTHTSGTLLLLGAYYETQVQFTSSDSYTIYIIPKQNNLTFYASSFIGSIDNVSVKEFTEDVVVPYSGEGSLLLEPQSTNLITYSEDFSGWSKYNITVESDSDTSPDGNNKATLIKGNTNYLRHHIYKTLTGTVDGSYSIFAKAKELRYLQIASINTVNQYVNFDLQDGLVGTVGSDFSNAKIEEFSSGWYRLSVTSDNRYNSFYISLVSGTNATWLEKWTMSNNTDGLYIWGAQLEELSHATSYIPTNGSTVTRLADVCNNSGSSDLINSTEGVLYAEISALASGTGYRVISIGDGSTSNVVRFYYSPTANRIGANLRSNSVNVFSIANLSISNDLEFIKVAISYKLNDFKIYINGTKVQSYTSGNVPIGLNELAFDNGAGNDVFYGNVKCVAVFKEALTDTELEKLTTI